MKRSILTWPRNAVALATPARDVPEDVSFAELSNLIGDMFETMKDAGGIGLAAPQIGVPWRLFVMSVEGNDLCFINPVKQVPPSWNELQTFEEGCLSFPGIFEPVVRSEKVIITAKDLDTIEFGIQCFTTCLEGIEAQCAQHEMEHLDGITKATKWGSVTTAMMKRKIHKAAKAASMKP